MTYEEAIKKIKQFGLYHAIEDLPNSVFTVQAFNMAIEALEKQISKNPIFIEQKELFNDDPFRTTTVEIYRCPCCGKALMYFGKGKRCPECGQLINWGCQ